MTPFPSPNLHLIQVTTYRSQGPGARRRGGGGGGAGRGGGGGVGGGGGWGGVGGGGGGPPPRVSERVSECISK